jgi:hypothetical protein
MNILEEMENLAEGLKQQRDEINVQLHLAGMEAKDEWEKSEHIWDQFLDKLAEINDDTKETGDQLIHTTKIIGDELKSLYARIKDRLSD